MNIINECIKSGQVSYRGENTERFENILSDYVGAYVVCTNSGTVALQLAIQTLELYEEYILCPSITYVATANAIIHTNNEPHFIDSKKCDLTVDYRKLESDLNCLHTCIMPVWVLGYPPRMEYIKKYAKKMNMYIIEDACQALGSFYDGQHAGTIGDIGAISFNGNKIITTGGGGALVTKNKKFYERAKLLSTQGGQRNAYKDIGHNYRMPALNASLGIMQFENKERWLKEQKKKAQKSHIVWNRWKIQDPEGEPIWAPIHTMEPYKPYPTMDDLSGAEWIGENVRIK
jgi:perosamine synthetase